VEEERLGDSGGYADYLNLNMKVIMMDLPGKIRGQVSIFDIARSLRVDRGRGLPSTG